MADEKDCRCFYIKIGSELTKHKNWNPDCPVHPWSAELQAQARRAVEWQRRAREARRQGRGSK